MTILQALDDPQLLGAAFPDPKSWGRWRIVLKAMFGLPMTAEEVTIFLEHGAGRQPPTEPAREAWFVVGRRGGKSRIAAAVAVYLACFRDYHDLLAPGERGTLALIAADRQQARTVFRYVCGLLDGSPVLGRLVERRTAESIDLTNGVTIEVHTASFRSVRGYTVVGAVLDEVAFWRSEDSANPDREIVDALRPAMATVPGALLVAISSPYARRGVLWDAYRRHYGQDGDVLVWRAATRAMNPCVPERVIADAYAADEAVAAAEYGAEFRRDLEAFVPREVVDACTVPGRVALPPLASVTYEAFVDPSGGSVDSFTLAIAHRERRGDEEVYVVDVMRERRAPCNPSDVVADYAALLAAYDVTWVTGDRYAGEWPREAFRKLGIIYEPAEQPKSDLYRDVLPLLTSQRVELPDLPRLHAQLCALERRTGRSGRDTIDHPPGGHDDLANAVAGALVGCSAGTDVVLLVGESSSPGAPAGYGEQVRELIDLFSEPAPVPGLFCATCDHAVRRDGRLWCGPRRFFVTPALPACFHYSPEHRR